MLRDPLSPEPLHNTATPFENNRVLSGKNIHVSGDRLDAVTMIRVCFRQHQTKGPIQTSREVRRREGGNIPTTAPSENEGPVAPYTHYLCRP